MKKSEEKLIAREQKNNKNATAVDYVGVMLVFVSILALVSLIFLCVFHSRFS